jgi:DNA-binding transcriptional LysR family regulator
MDCCDICDKNYLSIGGTVMLDSLRHLVLIAEHGTFRAAADQAHLSQPALTASIRRLEDWAGARLLDRGRHGAMLTAPGAALLSHARAALAAVEDGKNAVAQVAGLHAGEVRVGAGTTVCTYLLPPALAEFRRRHPGIRITLREVSTDAGLAALEAGEIDLCIVTPAARTVRHGEPWLRDQLVVVSAPGVDPRGAPFVTLLPGATTRALLTRHFPGAEIAMELGGIGAILAHVKSGVGLALVSRAAVQGDLADGRLVLVPDRRTPLHRPLRIFHRGTDRLSPAATALLEVLRAHARARKTIDARP